RRTNHDVLESGRFECAQYAKQFVAIHGAQSSPVPSQRGTTDEAPSRSRRPEPGPKRLHCPEGKILRRPVQPLALRAQLAAGRDRTRVKLAFVGTLGLALLAAAPDALACTCITPGPACQAFWRTDAVFDATVERIEITSHQERLGDREYTLQDKFVH